MKLTILGSGTYQPELERHESAYLIQTNKQNLCFDFGRGTIEQLLKVGVHVNQLEALFITHWHGDHVNDLIALLQVTISPPADHGLWPVRKSPLKIYGPAGTLEKIKALVEVIHENPELKNLGIKEITAGDTIELNNIKITSYLAKHNNEITALCFRLEAEGKVFAYSGDSVESNGLAKAIKNADLAVVEAGWPDEVQPKTHFTGARAAKFAESNGVKKLVITHMAPLYLQKFDPQKDAEKCFSGQVIVAKDLLKIKI
mgnify:CR=1 FL=1